MFRSWISALCDIAAEPDDPSRRLISDAIPNVPLTNQFNDALRFRKDFVASQGVLIINTMYTTCRGSCPGTSAAIESLRQSLSPVFGKRLKFLSITLEPHIDTPQKLLSYSRIYGAGERKPELCEWHFANIAKDNLETLRRSLGFFELDPQLDQDITQHASLLLIGNVKSDRWCKLPAELSEAAIIDTIRRFAGNTPEERFGISG